MITSLLRKLATLSDFLWVYVRTRNISPDEVQKRQNKNHTLSHTFFFVVFSISCIINKRDNR